MPAGTFVLGVDLDGVCGDYTAAFAGVVAAAKGCAVADLPSGRSWDFKEWDLDDLGGFEKLHRAAVLEHRIFRDMPAMPGCSDVLWRLSDAGVWIRIITHRLVVHWGHQIAVADTVAWLDDNNIPYRDLCFLGRKPEVEADLYIDDAPHNVDALRANGNDVLVFDAPYNQDVAAPRVASWADAEDLILDHMSGAGFTVEVPLPLEGRDTERLRRRVDHVDHNEQP
jgi:5'(3')-deoxyribonucleotidase